MHQDRHSRNHNSIQMALCTCITLRLTSFFIFLSQGPHLSQPSPDAGDSDANSAVLPPGI